MLCLTAPQASAADAMLAALETAGVGAVSLISMSPLPALVWLGAELVLLPLIDSPPVRRLVARKRLERARNEFAAWRQRAIDSLHPDSLARFRQMESLCQQIETNYLGLHGISRMYLSEQREKLVLAYVERQAVDDRYRPEPPGDSIETNQNAATATCPG